ncbi:MAG: 2-hydroxychromene-2-carboxylate isomerase [Arenicellales bacterium]
MKTLQWYFDYISPFSYLQWAHQLPKLEGMDVKVELEPILFAGLLKHWGHKGPAEIPAKRRFTYRHIVWLADRLGVPLRIPRVHPFNPLPLLRLSIARGNDPRTVGRLFEFVWRDGHVPGDEGPWLRLLEGLDAAESDLEDAVVKQALLANGEEAIAKGVFGVPTFVADGEVFWGVDGFELLLDYLADPAVIATPRMRAADETPSGV